MALAKPISNENSMLDANHQTITTGSVVSLMERALVDARLVLQGSRGPEACSEAAAHLNTAASLGLAAWVLHEKFEQDAQGHVVLPRLGMAARVGEFSFRIDHLLLAQCSAIICRNWNALKVLCSPRNIMSHAPARSESDRAVSWIVGLLAYQVVAPEQVPHALTDLRHALSDLPASHAKDEAVLVGNVLTHLHEEDYVQFDQAMKAHAMARRQRAQGFSLLLTALGVLAVEQSFVVSFDEPELPMRFVYYDDLVSPDEACSFFYDLQSVVDSAEIHMFFDMHGLSSGGPSQLVDVQGQLHARYQLPGGPGQVPTVANFLLLNEPHSLTPPGVRFALDPGQLLLLAQKYASFVPAEKTAETLRQQRVLVARAVEAVEFALGRVLEGRDGIQFEQLHSRLGRAAFQKEPGRFGRLRMQAYQHGLRAALSEIDQALGR